MQLPWPQAPWAISKELPSGAFSNLDSTFDKQNQ
jgi:hypothetical protein